MQDICWKSVESYEEVSIRIDGCVCLWFVQQNVIGHAWYGGYKFCYRQYTKISLAIFTLVVQYFRYFSDLGAIRLVCSSSECTI